MSGVLGGDRPEGTERFHVAGQDIALLNEDLPLTFFYFLNRDSDYIFYF